METAIQVVWWIGLVGALIPTLVILKEVAVVLRALRDIHRLAELTRDAARGIADNVAVGPRLALVGGPGQELRETADVLAVAAASIERKLGVLAPGQPARED